MATPAPVQLKGASEQVITLHKEQWTAEVARLLLEADEGWVGFRNAAAWGWCDETYAVFAAVCHERQWSCNSQSVCVSMLHALRTGAINMKLSSSTRSDDGFAQWSLAEMRELGAQMKRVVDGQSPTLSWSAQFQVFVEVMKAADASYRVEDRTVEDFAARAGKYVPDRILKLIDPNAGKGKATAKTKRTWKRVTKGPVEEAKLIDSSELLVPRRDTKAKTTRTTTTKRGRLRSEESEGDTSYHDPTSEDEAEYWEDASALLVPRVDGTQELVSQGELRPAEEQQTLNSADPRRPSLPGNVADEEKREATDRSRPSFAASSRRRQVTSAQKRASPDQDAADQTRSAKGRHNGGTTRQPSRKYQRVQRPTVNVNGHNNSNYNPEALQDFRSLDPYDRMGKPWGEFVVEILLAERTARNADELDYVQFVRGLYEI